MLTKAVAVAGGVAAGLVSSLDFSGTIGLGSIIVAAMVTILAGAFNLRTRVYRDQIDGWKGNYEQEKTHSAMLDERLEKAVKDLGEAKALIQRFEQLPNLERIVKMMNEQQERADSRAETRHRELVAEIRALRT